MKSMKQLIALILTVTMMLSLTGCDSSNSSSGGIDKKNTFSYWIVAAEDSSNYVDYRDNPGIQYLLSKSYGENNKKLELEFLAPAAGNARENCVTMIGTGEYSDIMDLAYYPGTALDLYEEGIALDLTPYVEQYMPNYLAFLEENPNLKLTATNLVDGEPKYLQLYSYGTGKGQLYNWCGWCYRRDWIVKYGKNPVDGSSFSGSYTEKLEDGTDNKESWVDNVVFPSGGSDPMYISDWEWMLDIFQTALKEEGIADGYGMSMYYPGYIESGDLVSAFGGGSGGWYKTPEGVFQFGPVGDGFRTYLQCFSTWYKNGWIDKAFTEHSSDLFYKVDSKSVRQGKVGLWFGLEADMFNKMNTGEENMQDIMVFPACNPINDIYGTEEQQNKEPYCMYQVGQEGTSIMITDKALKKDLPTLFAFLDSLYTYDFAKLKSFGFSKEQYEEIKPEFYTEHGFTDGGYYDSGTVNAKGQKVYYYSEAFVNDASNAAAKPIRIVGLDGEDGTTEMVKPFQTEASKRVQKLWASTYINSGCLPSSFEEQLSSDDAKTFSKIQTQVREFLSKNIPSFIKGDKDPFNDDDWAAYLKAVSKYSPETNTKLFQDLYDSLIK